MVTITQTVEEFLPTTITKLIMPLKAKIYEPPKTEEQKKEMPPQTLGCPPDCSCKKTIANQPMKLFFNVLGILVALVATYMIVTSNSNLYLVFWVCYSVLRRLLKPKNHSKQD